MTTGSPLLRNQLVELVGSAVAQVQADGRLPRVPIPEITIERAARPEFGDFATSFPLRAKKAFGPQAAAPLGIAQELAAVINANLPAYLSAVETAPPGFLNFTLADDWVRAQVDTILELGPEYGRVDLGHGRRLQVEFVSANPTGPLHVGTGRNAALGDTLARVLAKAGWDVSREYYYNDAGSQMANLHHSVWVQYQRLLGRDVEPAETDYRGEYVADLAATIMQDFGNRFADLPESNAAEIGEIAVQQIMQWIENELRRLRIEFDNWASEAAIIRAGQFDAVLDLLRSRDLLYEREGARWLRSTQLGDERDRVLIRSDGRPTYTATDIAYHYDKFFVRRFERVIDVWGADHQGQVPSMKAVVRALGVSPEQFDILIYQMVNVLRNGQPVRMGKRAGNFVTVGELLDEVGPDAMRWFLVSRGADAMMEFDLDLAKKQSAENPVFYVQYAHARLASILQRAAGLPQPESLDLGLLTQPTELVLLRRMLQLPEIVELGAREMEPHHVPHYAYELARATQAWYEAGNDDPAARVLTDDAPVRAARLRLAAAARQVLANALDLVGVAAPESM